MEGKECASIAKLELESIAESESIAELESIVEPKSTSDLEP